MIEQLEQVKINADNISSVLSRKRSSLRGIKVERKRLLLKKVDDKKKRQAEKKLKKVLLQILYLKMLEVIF